MAGLVSARMSPDPTFRHISLSILSGGKASFSMITALKNRLSALPAFPHFAIRRCGKGESHQINGPDRNTPAGYRTFLACRDAFAQPEFGAMQFRPVILALGSNPASLCHEIIALSIFGRRYER